MSQAFGVTVVKVNGTHRRFMRKSDDGVLVGRGLIRTEKQIADRKKHEENDRVGCHIAVLQMVFAERNHRDGRAATRCGLVYS